MDSGERGMNPVAMTVINPRKECWPSWGSNQRRVLKCATLPAELKMLDLTKLKAFADDKFSLAKMTISLFDRVENTAGKEENDGFQNFVPFFHSVF